MILLKIITCLSHKVGVYKDLNKIFYISVGLSHKNSLNLSCFFHVSSNGLICSANIVAIDIVLLAHPTKVSKTRSTTSSIKSNI